MLSCVARSGPQGVPGSHHPVLLDGRDMKNIHRGYSHKHHRFPVPEYLASADLAQLLDAIEDIRAAQANVSVEALPRVAGCEAPAGVRRSPTQAVHAFRVQITRGPPSGLAVPAERHPNGFFATAGFPFLPPVQEILAESDEWDPWGARWGRDAHWPLIVSVGLRRYRSEGMKHRRHAKKRTAAAAKKAAATTEAVGRCASGAEGSGWGKAPGAGGKGRGWWGGKGQGKDQAKTKGHTEGKAGGKAGGKDKGSCASGTHGDSPPAKHRG